MSLPKESLVDAYSSMRSGVLYLFISWIIMSIAFVPVIMSIFAITTYETIDLIGRRTPGRLEETLPVIGGVLYLLVAFIVMLIAAAVIALIGLWGKFIPGVSKLASVNSEFSTSATLIKIGMFWGLILLIIGIVLTIIIIGIVIVIVAAIFMFLGGIGLIILNFKLNEFEKNSLYLVAGILFIIGIFIPIASIASIIGWILMYIALGDSIKKWSTATFTPSVQQSLV